MTAYVTPAHNLLLRSLGLRLPSIRPNSPNVLAVRRPIPSSPLLHEHDTPELPPMLFRSECFAEDLFSSSPSQ